MKIKGGAVTFAALHFDSRARNLLHYLVSVFRDTLVRWRQNEESNYYLPPNYLSLNLRRQPPERFIFVPYCH